MLMRVCVVVVCSIVGAGLGCYWCWFGVLLVMCCVVDAAGCYVMQDALLVAVL